jgi:hypothetical protein
MDTNEALIWSAVALAVILGLLVWYVIHKGRIRPGAHVFRASRLTKGNRIFPAQLIITSSSVTQLQPQWIGKQEQSLHMAHVASIDIDTNMIFSDVSIETTGGHNPLVCHGHSKADAVKIKTVIEQYQSEYYKKTHN